MYIYFINHLISYTLLQASSLGILWLILLFIFCFLAVHVIKLAKIGWNYREVLQKHDKPNENKPSEPPKENKAPTSTAQEPIYYIVERKRKRTKSSYGEPKQFRFK